MTYLYTVDTCKPVCNPEGGSCDTIGNCVCNIGWTGGNCDVAVCSPECVTGNGQCVAPNNCSCGPGWTGSQCETCIPADGCCEFLLLHIVGASLTALVFHLCGRT